MPDTFSQDLSKLNSLTKYPSIPTYHTLDPANGNLTMPPLDIAGEITGTEKIDGTNVRIILTDSGYYLGSREELLHWADDRVWNPAQGIVEATKPIADRLRGRMAAGDPENGATILFGEVFGGKTTANAKQYSGQRRVGWRLFDVVLLPADQLRDPLPATRVALDDQAGGRAEGLVVRTPDRSRIAKLRLEDYERTLRRWR